MSGDFVLDEYKRQKLADINRRTEEVFAKGFVFQTVQVRMNSRSLIFYQSLADLGGLLSNTIIPAADDLDPPLTVNLANIGAFTGAVKTFVRQLYADEAALKSAIRTAVDRAAVDAVTDAR